MYLTVARQLFVMAIIVVISFFFSRKNKFGEKEEQYLSRFLLYVINPCMIVSTFDVDFDTEKLKSLAFAIGLSFVFHFIMIILATVAINRKDSVSRVGIVFTNSGFIGIPLIRGVFGDSGVFYLMAYILAFNILQWTWGEYIMTGKFKIKKIITNPNVIACIAGFTIFCIPFRMPYIFIEPLRMVGNTNGAVSMILLGLLFAGRAAEKVHSPGDSLPAETSSQAVAVSYTGRLVRDGILRLLVCPLLALCLTVLVWRFFNDISDIYLITPVLFIAAACPVGMSVSSFAVIFGKDKGYASLLVSITSAACIVTIPLLVRVLELGKL